MKLTLPRYLCANPPRALRREWLVTNGIGGFAAGTVAGALSRRYHGLLVAALDPPVGRTLLVSKLDETATVAGRSAPLYTNVWPSGVESPNACRWLARFDLEWGVPTWTFDLPGARLVRRIWMEHGRNATFVEYEHAGGQPLSLLCRLMVNDRDYHSLTRGIHRDLNVNADGAELEVFSPKTGCRVVARFRGGDDPPRWKLHYTTCKDFHLSAEAMRGFDHLEDHFIVGSCTNTLAAGDRLIFTLASAEHRDVRERGALRRSQERARGVAAACLRCNVDASDQAPLPLAQLALAADQFIVARPFADEPDGHTIVAGYPWFTDWGRDTMISLPGLTLVTGRHDLARQILRTWSRFLWQGVIPNRFPDAGGAIEYHTADAALWYLWAIDQYFRFTGDVATLRMLYPVMREIVDWHRRGTVHNLHMADDGLIYAGEPGVNFTWMDAKIGDRVITPRIGKPVELSALWYDALWNMARLADVLDENGDEYARLASRCGHGFDRFWNPHAACCYDVLDGPGGHEALVRPNQVLAISLTHTPLWRQQQESVVRVCEHRLLTWFGLRTLAPYEPGYRGRYVGGPVERDESYHQGTAWGWLLGHFVLADFRVHKDPARARTLLAPMLGHLWTHGVGTLSEVFDADEPYFPNGCFAQAWTVGETLRAWWFTQGRGDAEAMPPPDCEAQFDYGPAGAA